MELTSKGISIPESTGVNNHISIATLEMQGQSSNLEAILSYYTIRGRSYEMAYLRQTITWPSEWVSPLPTEPALPMTKATLAVRATKIGTSSLLSTTPATLLPFSPLYPPPHAHRSPADQLSELPWREQWPHVQAVVHSLTPYPQVLGAPQQRSS